MRRIRTLITKEFLDLARNRTALLPVVIVTVLSLVLPFGIAVGVPAMTGHGLGEDADLLRVSVAVGSGEALSSDARIQLFLFQQFLMLFVLVAPAAALISLQSAILISSRANDPRTAQQFGVLIIIPLAGVLVAQFTGSLWLSAAALGLLGLGLLGVWLLLTLLSVAVFDREAILTRWR